MLACHPHMSVNQAIYRFASLLRFPRSNCSHTKFTSHLRRQDSRAALELSSDSYVPSPYLYALGSR
jgi:hypothetical protein